MSNANATLARIKDVRLYVAFTEDAAQCYQVKKVLEENEIPYILMAYSDDSAHDSLFTNLNTWSWGVNRVKMPVTRFPFVTWTSCYDDFETFPEIAFNVQDINTFLIPNKTIIK